MGNRSHHPVEIGALSEAKLLAGHFTGAGGADMVFKAGDIVTATRTATGTFNLKFRYKYPQRIYPFEPGIVGTTTGLGAICTAWDPVAGTATIVFSVGSVATDPATTDEVFLLFLVRNSGRNPTSW